MLLLHPVMPEDQYYFEDYLEYVLHITFAQTH